MSSKKQICFVEDREVKDHSGKVIETFRKGRAYKLPEASADHWLNRNAAVEGPAPKSGEKDTGDKAAADQAEADKAAADQAEADKAATT